MATGRAATVLAFDFRRDGWDHELAAVTGSSAAGYVAKLVVGV